MHFVISMSHLLGQLLVLIVLYYSIILQSFEYMSNGYPRSRLLELPVELRLLIYDFTRHTIIRDRPNTREGIAPIIIAGQAATSPARLHCLRITIDGAPTTALLRLCSTIRHEYMQNCTAFRKATIIALHNWGPIDGRASFDSLRCYLKTLKLKSNTLDIGFRGLKSLSVRLFVQTTGDIHS